MNARKKKKQLLKELGESAFAETQLTSQSFRHEASPNKTLSRAHPSTQTLRFPPPYEVKPRYDQPKYYMGNGTVIYDDTLENLRISTIQTNQQSAERTHDSTYQT